MIIFFLIILCIHALVNLYIGFRGWQALEQYPAFRPYFIGIMIVLFLSYLTARFIERNHYSAFAEVLNWTGSFWFAGMLYFFLLIVLIDLVRVGNYFFHFLPAALFAGYAKTKFILLLVSLGLVFSIIIYGYINASIVRIKEITVTVDKRSASPHSYRIAMLSDLHLGTIIGKRKLGKIVEKINALKPDIVLMAGDVVDENIKPVIAKNLGDLLLKIQSVYGTYAITGNHEFIGGVKGSVSYLENHGVKFLQDSSILIDSAFWVVGRYDRDMVRFTQKQRKPLPELLSQCDGTHPVILMDHQPFHLEETAQYPVDLQLSGHTHNGQLFPLNLVTRAMFKPDWGYRIIDKTQFYVSCGIGTWGPPVRIGNSQEIVLINFNLK